MCRSSGIHPWNCQPWRFGKWPRGRGPTLIAWHPTCSRPGKPWRPFWQYFFGGDWCKRKLVWRSTDNKRWGCDFEVTNRDDPTFPNLSNFKDKFDKWPMGKIRKYLSVNRLTLNNRASVVIQQEDKLVYRTYEHTLIMLALIGNVNKNTVRKKL